MGTWESITMPVQHTQCPATIYTTLFIAGLTRTWVNARASSRNALCIESQKRVRACIDMYVPRVPAQCQVSRYTKMKAKKLLRILAILVRSVTSQSFYRSYRYPYTLVCLLSIESLSSLRSQEGSADQKITQECLNEAFSAKATRLKYWKRHKQP